MNETNSKQTKSRTDKIKLCQQYIAKYTSLSNQCETIDELKTTTEILTACSAVLACQYNDECDLIQERIDAAFSIWDRHHEMLKNLCNRYKEKEESRSNEIAKLTIAHLSESAASFWNRNKP